MTTEAVAAPEAVKAIMRERPATADADWRDQRIAELEAENLQYKQLIAILRDRLADTGR